MKINLSEFLKNEEFSEILSQLKFLLIPYIKTANKQNSSTSDPNYLKQEIFSFVLVELRSILMKTGSSKL